MGWSLLTGRKGFQPNARFQLLPEAEAQQTL